MKDKRQTIQKNLVLNVVRASDNHPSAEEVYQIVVKDHPSISRSTVYRNLHNLVDEKQIRLVQVLNGPEHFDKTLAMHYHIQCTECNRASDIVVRTANDSETIVESSGYLVKSKEILYLGICPDCQEKIKKLE
ncbi:MAG: transcriptional repressor [Sphaerochaetaceae bacterium]